MIDLRQCKKCVYRMYIGRATGCGYLFYTGHARIKLNDLPGECSVYLPQKGNAALRRELLRKLKQGGLKPYNKTSEECRYLVELIKKDLEKTEL